MSHRPSPFLDPGTHSAQNELGILQLRRDHLIPAVLSATTDSDYAEGKVENTRFGSFPHSTLLDQPWGTQVLASVVDTGSRGKSKKRKREKDEDEQETPEPPKKDIRKDIVKAATATSGFVHLVPPTPETWTLCLPHRTQVVYTPDYSYILQRLRVRPGDHIIEAGAGSGSFTHAATRAVFNGYAEEEDGNSVPDTNGQEQAPYTRKRRRRMGKVFSYEFHAPRAAQLKAEIEEHGLSDIVTITNRDVYEDGFCLGSDEDPNSAPDADVVFLDLPAPWLALKHLTRSQPSAAVVKSVTASSDSPLPNDEARSSTPQPQINPRPFRSPLNSKKTTRICTFSPCIEQVTKTVSAMRSLGWLEIGMAEVQSKRLEVRRERIGLQEEGLRGANPSAATIAEAVQRLRDVEDRAKAFHGLQKEKQEEIMRKAEAKKKGLNANLDGEGKAGKGKKIIEGLPPSKQDRLDRAKKELENRNVYKEGRLVHRTEPELKTHTSYLVFAVLPRQWTREDEEKAKRKWG